MSPLNGTLVRLTILTVAQINHYTTLASVSFSISFPCDSPLSGAIP